VRCGVSPKVEPVQRPSFHLPAQCFAPPVPIKGLYPGGWGAHPRTEANGLAGAIGDLLDASALGPRCAEPQRRAKPEREEIPHISSPHAEVSARKAQLRKPWLRMEQAMRATDLLLQTGGFAVVVLDMASLAPETALRVPLATWFRYRAAAERTQSSVVVLTQTACAKSSAGLLLRMEKAAEAGDESTVFTGLACNIEVARERFKAPEKVVPLRKPPVRANIAAWQARSAWAGKR
jgi:recombination protein RecA